MLTRRHLALAGGAGLLAGAGAADDPIAAIERRHGGRLGVFVRDTGSGRSLGHRADERFLLCSSFKGLLAAFVLARADHGQDELATRIAYGRAAILGHSPVTEAHLAEGGMTVRDLCAAIVTESDNGGANLLLRHVGGPAALTAFLRRIGDRETRLDRLEMALNHRRGDCDTTTPRAIAGTAGTLVLGHVLAPASRALLEHWMVTCRTGLARLRAAFPPDWVTADKTGTSDLDCNDVAVVRRPGAAPLVMAAYYNNPPGMDGDAAEAALREVGAAIVAWSRG